MTVTESRPDLAGAPPVVHKLVHWLETTEVPDGLFAADVFTDFTPPTWRLQAVGPAGTVAIRRSGHPAPGRLTRLRYDPTPTGFVLEYAEEWDDKGDHWYARQMLRADVRDGAISEVSIYCTGDWDTAQVARHEATVTLIRP
ncbi:MAG: hypothetical protein QOI15_607 [Pseudonocardiales bacterium]|nr:hypothetical protein [Pseudonocardiales bacterium]MDT4942766.1 hypothetical protein [Pseudonocardiales bacterium]